MISKKKMKTIMLLMQTLSYTTAPKILSGETTIRSFLMQDMKGYLVADFDDILIICKKEEEAKFRDFVADTKSQKGDQVSLSETLTIGFEQ